MEMKEPLKNLKIGNLQRKKPSEGINPSKLLGIKDLRKKHKMRYKGFFYIEGDFVDKTVKFISEEYNLTKKEIIRDALIYYKMFLENNFNDMKGGNKNDRNIVGKNK